jgi:chaperonin cofactor prefoldin
MGKRTLRRHTERLHSLEQSLRHLDKAVQLCKKLEYKAALYRSIAMLLGMPLACVAVVFLTFLIHNFDGNGLYIGMGCALLASIVIRPALNQPETPMLSLERRVEELIRSRKRTQEAIQKTLDEQIGPAAIESKPLASADSEAA